MKTLVIIDGNALLHRAFHAIPPLTARNGQVVNAVYGFTTILLRVVRELKPDYLAVTFDAPGKNFRHTMYKEYKATRVKQPQDLYDQIPLIKKVVKGFGFPIFEVEGVEADDVIATIVEKTSRSLKDLEDIIVTGDMDTLQLIDARTSVNSMRKGVNDIVKYDAQAVKDRYRLSPEQMVDFKALRGDISDNIKGVPGIGEKTAVDLLNKFNTLEDVYKAVEKDFGVVKKSVAEKLLTHKKEAFQSKELVILKRDVVFDFNLESCKVGEPNRTELVELFRELDFHSLVKRLTENTNNSPAGVESVVIKKKQSKVVSRTANIETDEDYKNFIKKAPTVNECALEIIFKESPHTAKLVGCLLAITNGEKYYLPANKITQEFCSIVESKKIFIYDLKSAIEVLHSSKLKFDPLKFVDLMLSDYVLSPGSRNHELSSILLKQTGVETEGVDGQSTLFGIDTDILGNRLALFFQAGQVLEKELKEKDLLKVYEEMEAPLVSVLVDMEEVGIKLDIEYLKKISKIILKNITETTQKIYKLADREFNIASPQQLKEVLFDELEIPVEGIKKGKTGLSTAASELEKLQGQHPIIDLIMDYREFSKLQNTYTDVLPRLVDSSGRVHTTFNQAVTSTGRLSSSEPNLQNIPIKTELGRELRKVFISRPGYMLIKADYSQIELRIIAALSKDRDMMAIFERGEDIHRSTAAKINGVAESEVTFEMRQAAKAINFGVIYGLGARGLSQGAKVSYNEAQKFIERYFEVFKGVKTYLEETKLLAHNKGYVETFFGRRRYFPEINSSIHQVRASAERMATNAPMQGTAADIIKRAMIQLHSILIRSYEREIVTMLLQVHDELVFEVMEDKVDEIKSIIKKTMEGVVDFGVPIVVEIKEGKNWGEMN